jgi:hypothetical protein
MEGSGVSRLLENGRENRSGGETKKRPLSGPPFSKRFSGGNQRKLI